MSHESSELVEGSAPNL